MSNKIKKRVLGLTQTLREVRKMNVTDVSGKFLNNAKKRETLVVLHWTASGNAAGTMNYLRTRLNGSGSVGYNYIIDKKGDIYMLADPRVRWFHNTGRGTDFDKHTTSIALVMMDEKDLVTDKQIESLRGVLALIMERFNVTEVTHHAALNSSKRDFPESMFKAIMSMV